MSASVPEKRWIFLSEIAGAVAMWAVRQSPYDAPDGLTGVVEQFIANAYPIFSSGPGFTRTKTRDGMADVTREQVRTLLRECLFPIAQFQKWNERRNGDKNPLQFTSSFDGVRDPNADFIDLDALEMNVVREVWAQDDQFLTSVFATGDPS